ncbi:conserved hypothetical protein [Cenarchaeum symbiosum A]|uniref:Chromosome segregation and condensation protein ScpA n=1 Tax=Cenarchaeum symbiosum (strain A) TaxID=414004 RepID=A0RXG3_CENSY|nr:conserved hypothetical protein [Cenarchaeum symbiosum A]
MDGEKPGDISQAPVNILFNPSSIAKSDVWEIDLVKILDMLVEILERSGKRDLKVAGMAALSSSLIYRMKVESIFALQRMAMERGPDSRRASVDVDPISMPYRHESTYPVTLDELLGILNSLIWSIANPGTRKPRPSFEPADVPDLRDVMNTLENVIGRYEELIESKIRKAGSGLLGEITSGLELVDAIRCFFAVLFMARDGRVWLEQSGEDILITLSDGRGE